MGLNIVFLRTVSRRASGFVNPFSSAMSTKRANNGAALVQAAPISGGGAHASRGGGGNSGFLSLSSWA
jgi:hypothetical protein